VASQRRNEGGGGGGPGCNMYGSVGGGGGGYGTEGEQTNNEFCGKFHPGGEGGGVYGDDPQFLYLGSGGGSGYLYNSRGATGGKGGNGGGALCVCAEGIIIDGVIECNGADGGDGEGQFASGGGGGSGGGIALHASVIKNNGTIQALGGHGGFKGDDSVNPNTCNQGGSGGMGVIRIWCPQIEGNGSIVPPPINLSFPCLQLK